MKRSETVFLQIVIVLIGVAALGLLLWQPQVEGVNKNKTNLEIYFQDPFLALVYAGSIPFFVALYQAIRALGYAGRNQVFSPDVVKALIGQKVVAKMPSGKKDLAAVQAAFNRWREESGRPLCQISRVLAASVP